ncbi:signal recognition particle-docking protein FtsY [bacterium]|nr:signal recognition particle-docking protein FtsY [bacterium]
MAVPSAEEQTAVPSVEEGEAGADEPKLKKGFLRGAWEATKKLALTPVDPWFEAVAKGLDATRKGLVNQVASLFRLHGKVDEALWQELEDILIMSDVGAAATEKIIEELRNVVKEKKLTTAEPLLEEMRTILSKVLNYDGADVPAEPVEPLNVEPGRLNVILMVGVNGTGKTTSTAKLTHRLKTQGHKVILAAADTFRAAAIDQLLVWGNRLGVDVIHQSEGSDPAAVVFDAVNAAKARKADVLIVDTAGRLHSKLNLMEELRKIRRVLTREIPDAPHETLLVLDATTGQNAVNQARTFNDVANLTGLVLAKLDGTAKGGIVVAIAQEFQIPVKYIGLGEKIEDLQVFHPKPFLSALFGESDG